MSRGYLSIPRSSFACRLVVIAAIGNCGPVVIFTSEFSELHPDIYPRLIFHSRLALRFLSALWTHQVQCVEQQIHTMQTTNCLSHNHWNRNVFIGMVWLLATLEFVKMTTCSAASNQTVVKWEHFRLRYFHIHNPFAVHTWIYTALIDIFLLLCPKCYWQGNTSPLQYKNCLIILTANKITWQM